MKIRKTEYNILKENEKHFFDLVKYLYGCVSNECVFGGNEKLNFSVYTKYHFDISIIELYKLIGLDFSGCIIEEELKESNNMLKWHDCKSDPPKESGRYILVYKDIVYNKLRWDAILYSFDTKEWTDGFFRTFDCPIKWAEVNLPE